MDEVYGDQLWYVCMMKMVFDVVGKDHDKLDLDLDDDEDDVWSSQPICRMWTKACLKTLASSDDDDDDDGDYSMMMMMIMIDKVDKVWDQDKLGP